MGRFQWPVRPEALPENIVSGVNYRFTVLTPQLIRMEYAPEGIFEDRASQTVFYRDFPPCNFSRKLERGILTVETENLVLSYRAGEPFAKDTLSVRLKMEPASTWEYGDDFEDLGGTTRTLDCVNGACALGRGIVSRNGFSVLPDGDTLVLEEDGWVGVRHGGTIDYYFFGYGYQYVEAVQDFFRLTGVPPLLPAYALGNWWSRYHAYTQEEYCDLVQRFHDEDVPFSVGVVDMDWHIVDIPEELREEEPALRDGWTGYSWNRELFPDYRGFLKFLKEKGLHTALNLHPAQGIRKHEEMYPQMARECGIDPASGKRVALDVLSPKFMADYFDIVHHPYETDGVDFWWMDWQQGTDYWWIHEPNKPGEYSDPRERMDPLWMLNHLHIMDISRNGKRPMFFSRYAGPGSQRYPVGFSGDTFVTWESLDFQPYFTATASNIGYCAWSHDIGGHQPGYHDDNLQVRWLQFGVFSPITRLHSTNSEFMSKEPWCYGEREAGIMKQWLRLRHAMFPYLYTMNYRTHTQLLPLIQPMYYSHPKAQAAYEVKNQYWFGSELVVAPITSPDDPTTRMGKVTAWLPRGEWFDFFTGLHYHSKRGRYINLHRELKSMPILAKAGAIVPLAEYPVGENRLYNSGEMNVLVFPGASNSFTLYEDFGENNDYQDGNFAKTRMCLDWGEQEATFTISPAEGDLTVLPGKRSWKISFRGFHKDTCIQTNGENVSVHRVESSNTTQVTVTANVTDAITLSLRAPQLIHDNADVMGRCRNLVLFSQVSDKGRLMEIVRDNSSIHWKMCQMYFNRREWTQVADALKELLTLTEEEYQEE